jgi:pilus assembly protein CpaC
MTRPDYRSLPAAIALFLAATAIAATRVEVTAGRSVVLDNSADVHRVSVANGDVAEALAVSRREILVNGKAPGTTSLIVWQQGGERILYDVAVLPDQTRLEVVREQLRLELADQPVHVVPQGDTVFLTGTVSDEVGADRAAAIAGVLGKVINLLRVAVPPAQAQVLLKVRFANVDRSASSELGANIISTGALNTPGAITTGQFSPPRVQVQGRTATLSLADALNVFLFRPDLNLGVTLKALENRQLLEILAEPNVLAIDGQEASFVAGGEFPFPTLQGGGAGLGAVTIQFREFGVRIHFRPRVTPRGSIRLHVMPEVSALDYANGLVFQGFNIPALSTRRVETEVELESGQGFAIAGMLDNRLTETINKIPGLSSIPLLGKVFESRSLAHHNTELLVLITPELVKPIPAGKALPQVTQPKEFMKGAVNEPPRTPGPEVTGPVPAPVPRVTVPVEQLQKGSAPAAENTPPAPVVPFIPVPVMPFANPQPNPGLSTPSGQGGK